METINNWFMFLIVNSVWQITAVTLVSLLCDRLLQKTTARVRHGLWVTALILAVGLPLFSGMDLKALASLKTKAISPQPVQAPAIEASQLAVNGTPQPVQPLINVSETFALILFSGYLLLIVYRVFKLAAAFRRAREIGRDSFRGEWSEGYATIIEECKTACGVKNVEILCSGDVPSPITLGAIRPIIVLPETLLQETDQNILITAISHELNHIRRRDYLLNLLYELIFIPISFHPAATLVRRRIRETRELVCDEYVTERMVEPAAYARSLVSIAGLAMDLGRGANLTIGILDGDALEKRIMKILNRSKITAYRRNLLLGSAAMVFALAVIATMSFTLTPVVAQQQPNNAEIEAKRKAEDEARRREEMTPESKESFEVKVRALKEELEAKQRAERESEELGQAALANPVKLSMAEAINIATALQPGTVLESKLAYERNGGENRSHFT